MGIRGGGGVREEKEVLSILKFFNVSVTDLGVRGTPPRLLHSYGGVGQSSLHVTCGVGNLVFFGQKIVVKEWG